MRFRSIIKFLFISVLIISSMPLFSQSIHKFIAYDKEVYKYDTAAIRLRKEALFTKYVPLFPSHDWLVKYVDQLLESEEWMLSFGTVYQNWSEAEEYLNKVVRAALGNEWKPENKVRVRRDEQINAFMMEDGKIYVNVGLIASAASESELAATIGHEYGHYKSQHFYKDFLKRCEEKENVDYMRILRNPGSMSGDYSKAYYANSREQEKEADNISIACMKASKYNLKGIPQHFKRYLDDEKKRSKEKGYKTFAQNLTHPPTQERLSNAEKEIKNVDTSGRRDFLVDEATFNKIKKQCIDESIFLSLRNLDFKNAIETCYQQLLYYPDDEFYLFYINEAIRRYLIVKPFEAESNFITGEYNVYDRSIAKDKMAKVSLSKKMTKLSTGELSKLINYQYEFLLFNNEKEILAKLPDNYLTRNDTIEFATNEEALEFFMERQKQLNQSSVNFVKKMLKPGLEAGSINSIHPDLNQYNEVMKALDAKETDTSIAVVLLDLDYFRSSIVFWKAGIDENSIYGEVVKNSQTIFTAPFYPLRFDKYDLVDKRILYDFLDNLRNFAITGDELDKFYKEKKNVNYDMYKSLRFKAAFLSPEIIPFLRKNHLSKIVFSDVNISESSNIISYNSIPIPIGNNYVMELSNYWIDLDSPTFVNQHYIRRVGKKVFNGPGIANEMLHMAKILEDDVKARRESNIK